MTETKWTEPFPPDDWLAEDMDRDLTFLTWREKTWRERGQTAIAWTGAVIVGMVIAGAILWGIFESLNGLGRHQSEYNRCLQHATNGYEIKQCQ
jgi:hypothetical protein